MLRLLAVCVCAGGVAATNWLVGWTGEAAPSDLVAFLQPLDLTSHTHTLASLGYDDVHDFAKMSAADLQDMKAGLLRERIPQGHVAKIIRAIEGLRHGAAPDSSTPSLATQQPQHRRLQTSSEPGVSTLHLRPTSAGLGEVVHGASLTARANGQLDVTTSGEMKLSTSALVVDAALSASGADINGALSATTASTSGDASIGGTLSVTGDASFGAALTTSASGVQFSDGTTQTTATAFTGRPALALPHNLINNGMMSRLSGSVPTGYSVLKYSCDDCSATIEAVHTYTKCFEGPYTATKGTNTVDNCDDATGSNPYWFRRYYMGPRIGRGGMGGGGWGGRSDGKVLKITGSRNSGANIFVNVPVESRHVSARMIFRCYLKIIKGGATFGTDQGTGVQWRSSDTAAATATQGWLHVHKEQSSSHMANQEHTHAWNLKLFGEGDGNYGDFEIYFALPYLANVWLPDADGSDDTYTAHWSASVTDILIDGGYISGRRRISDIGAEVSDDEESDETSNEVAVAAARDDELFALRDKLDEQQNTIKQLSSRLEKLEAGEARAP